MLFQGLFASNPSNYATVRWTYHPTVFQVTKAGDAAGTCSASACTFRQALVATNLLPLATNPAVLIQLMLSPGGMTQTSDLVVGTFGSSRIITIDGTDASGNPWIVGDALAAAQGTQSPFLRAIDLKNLTKLRIDGNNVTVRGLAISNTTPGGVPGGNLVESIGTNTHIEAVRLDGGASGACGTCVGLNRSLLDLAGGLAHVTNVEGRAAFSNGARVAFSGGPTEVSDSWFHHNYGSGTLGDGLVLTRNVIELTGRRLSDNAVVTNDGVGVRGDAGNQIDTASNLIRNQTSFGISALLNSFGLDFAHDAVCGNGDTGISVEKNSGATATTGTGLATVYNSGHGVDFFGPFAATQIQFNNDSAFTANSQCGFSNNTAITASAVNNQWRGATTLCSQSADRCALAGQGPINCDPIQNFTDAPIVLDLVQPTFPRNAMFKGQTLRVQGTGFNAVDGNPEAGVGPGQANCSTGSGDVSNQNCCRNKTKANVCVAGAPPNPPGNGSNCVAMLDVLGQWKPLAVTSVTPTTIVTEVPDPSVVCIGEGYLQSTRVVKQGTLMQIAAQMDYCRNLP